MDVIVSIHGHHLHTLSFVRQKTYREQFLI